MKRPVRIGLIGTGVAAEQLYLPALRELGGKIELRACTNRTLEKAVAYARLAGIPRVVGDSEELLGLPEVDAVIVSLPIDLQPAVVRRALVVGKPVLSEKPIAPSTAIARELVKLARRHRTPWLVGENYAFLEGVSRLEGWVQSGKLGDLILCEARQLVVMDRKNPYFHTSWRRNPRFAGSFVLDAGVHLAHVIRRCLGMPTEVQGMTAGLVALPPPDTAVATLRFANGALGTWTSCFGARHEGPMLRILGTKRSAELHFDHLDLVDRRGQRRRFATSGATFSGQFAHFADMVRSGIAPRVSPEEALLDLELIERIACPRGSGPALKARSTQRSRASIK